MHVLFDCDNYNTLRQDIFKKVKATIDSTELDTDNKLPVQQEKKRACLIPYIFNSISRKKTIQLLEGHNMR